MLQVVVDGLSNVIIAERLNIIVTTVKRHLSTIFAKLEVSNWREVVAAAHVRHVVNGSTGRSRCPPLMYDALELGHVAVDAALRYEHSFPRVTARRSPLPSTTAMRWCSRCYSRSHDAPCWSTQLNAGLVQGAELPSPWRTRVTIVTWWVRTSDLLILCALRSVFTRPPAHAHRHQARWFSDHGRSDAAWQTQ